MRNVLNRFIWFFVFVFITNLACNISHRNGKSVNYGKKSVKKRDYSCCYNPLKYYYNYQDAYLVISFMIALISLDLSDLPWIE